MNQKEFMELDGKLMARASEILLAKGRDYSGLEDRFANLKGSADRVGLTVYQVWSVFFFKHFDAIRTFFEGDYADSEPIEGRFADAINYLRLLRGYAVEFKRKTHPQPIGFRWWKNGGHPEDKCHEIAVEESGEIILSEGKVVRYFRHPEVPESSLCPDCGRKMFDHGWLDFPPNGQKVCPGNWIVTMEDGSYRAIADEVFQAILEVKDPGLYDVQVLREKTNEELSA